MDEKKNKKKKQKDELLHLYTSNGIKETKSKKLHVPWHLPYER